MLKFMKLNHAKFGMTVICMILGIIIGIQAKTVKGQAAITDIQRVSEVSAELKRTLDENKALFEQNKEYERKIEEYQKSFSSESQSLKLLQQEIEQVRNMAGLTELKGKGLTVILEDSKKANSDTADTNAFLVHAEDLLSVINELNVAGAEAISINGQRIIGSSSIRCAGPIVNVNGVRIAAPFEILAIGEQDIMESALNFPGGVVDSLSPWGIRIVIKKSSEVTIPAYSQAITFKNAYPSKKEGE